MIFILEIPGEDLVFDLFTVHFCAISRNVPRNYLNLIRNQDQEITRRAPGIWVRLVLDLVVELASTLASFSS